MSVFEAAALATEASPEPQLPHRVARGSSSRHTGSGSSFLHVTADQRRLDRRKVSRHCEKRRRFVVLYGT